MTVLRPVERPFNLFDQLCHYTPDERIDSIWFKSGLSQVKDVPVLQATIGMHSVFTCDRL